jgi:hypothetical protein
MLVVIQCLLSSFNSFACAMLCPILLDNINIGQNFQSSPWRHPASNGNPVHVGGVTKVSLCHSWRQNDGAWDVEEMSSGIPES